MMCLFIRGGAAFTQSINIYTDPQNYLKTMSWFAHTKREHLGYDVNFETCNPSGKMWLQFTQEELGDPLKFEVVSVIYSSIAGTGRSTRVIVVIEDLSGDHTQHLIVKDVWQYSNLPSDGQIHVLLEQQERLDKTREHLGAF
jgi:hypothetical protein